MISGSFILRRPFHFSRYPARQQSYSIGRSGQLTAHKFFDLCGGMFDLQLEPFCSVISPAREKIRSNPLRRSDGRSREGTPGGSGMFN
jgi:hypothetical protein